MTWDIITHHWDAVGALGQWVGAAGTFAAVVVALWLGVRANTAQVRVRVGFLMVPGEWVQRVEFSAVNEGLRAVRMVSTGIRLPDGKTVAPILIPAVPRLPTTLEVGNEVSWQIPLQELADLLKNAGFTREATFRPYYRDSLRNDYQTSWRFDPSKRVAGPRAEE